MVCTLQSCYVLCLLEALQRSLPSVYGDMVETSLELIPKKLIVLLYSLAPTMQNDIHVLPSEARGFGIVRAYESSACPSRCLEQLLII